MMDMGGLWLEAAIWPDVKSSEVGGSCNHITSPVTRVLTYIIYNTHQVSSLVM